MSKVVNNEIQANSLADNKIQAKEIKVGQIYALPLTETPIVVTDIQYTPEEPFDWIYVISVNGTQARFWRKTMEILTLIAEYPTWQEAVNSPEFKGEK